MGATAVRILISDDLSPEAKTILERIPGAQVELKVGLKPEALREIIGGYDALAVRSATKVTADILAAAGKLRVIGRAGTGVDNIDLPAATRKGVVVMNAPGGNSVSVAEHTLFVFFGARASGGRRCGQHSRRKVGEDEVRLRPRAGWQDARRGRHGRHRLAGDRT